MKVKFYGTRGSIPVAEKEFMYVGGNTPCILLTFNSNRIAILDAGTGIRKLGNDLIAKNHEQFDNIIIGLSHTHWDHIQGFPFFKPAYDKRRHFTIAISGKERTIDNLESVFSRQMQQEYFPVSLENMGASFTFMQPEVNKYVAPSGIEVEAVRQKHPGYSYGYRIIEGENVVVYCTDVEHIDGIAPEVTALAEGADLLIHDAQYTPEELKDKRGWGHSSWEQAVEVAERAGVKRLALFHHDPEHSDDFLLNLERTARKRFPEAFLAKEGMEVEV